MHRLQQHGSKQAGRQTRGHAQREVGLSLTDVYHRNIHRRRFQAWPSRRGAERIKGLFHNLG